MSFVRFDLESGLAHFGDRSIPFETASDGSLKLSGGSRIRPITFGERQNLVACAQIAGEPIHRFVARLVSLARIDRGEDPEDVVALFGLVLAGAAHSRHATMQAVTAIMTARQWPYETVLTMPARDVDEIAHEAAPPEASPWRSWIFPQADLSDPGGMAEFLARQLLERDPDRPQPRQHLQPAPVRQPDLAATDATSPLPPDSDGSVLDLLPAPTRLSTSPPGANPKPLDRGRNTASGFRGVRAAIRAIQQKLVSGDHDREDRATPTKNLAMVPSPKAVEGTGPVASDPREDPQQTLGSEPEKPAERIPSLPDRFSPAIALPPPQVQANPAVKAIAGKPMQQGPKVPGPAGATWNAVPTQTETSGMDMHPAAPPARTSLANHPIPFPQSSSTANPAHAPSLHRAGGGAAPPGLAAALPFREARPGYFPEATAPGFKRWAMPQAPPLSHQADDLAQQMADLLHLEADLRGILP